MNARTVVRLQCVAVLFVAASACHRKDTVAAQPSAAGHDQPKIYELNLADASSKERLLHGFYTGTDGWLWTARRFAVSLDPPPPLDASTSVAIDVTAPTELMNRVKTATLTVKVNGRKVGTHTFAKETRAHLVFDIPPGILKDAPATVECELDRAFTDERTNRELGLIAVSMSLSHEPTATIGHDTAVELARNSYLRMMKERQRQMPLEKQHDLMKLFHEIPVWRNTWFHNVPIEKNPLDLWMMQQIIYEVQPDFVIETGTWKGGSALYWAHTLNGMGLVNSRVLTVDILDQTSTAATHPLWSKYVVPFKGSSTDPAIVADIGRRTSGRKVLVTLDSDHSMKHVLNELNAYAPLVTRGSYIVVEDTHMDGVPTQPGFGPGPLAAVMRFLAENGSKDFEQDFAREAMIMTFNPGGWLRRK